MPKLTRLYFTNPTNFWVCPENVTDILLIAAGGGGGGGGGGTTGGRGGGGGGGSFEYSIFVPVIPFMQYEILVGAGGLGGLFSNQPNNNGGVGGDTIFRTYPGNVVVAQFVGASGGHGDSPNSTGDTTTPPANGGAPFSYNGLNIYEDISGSTGSQVGLGAGGNGQYSTSPHYGNYNIQGLRYPGGAIGSHSGGGAAGPQGPGANGGSPGSNASANTGAGGGGGDAFSNGGNGGSGYLYMGIIV